MEVLRLRRGLKSECEKGWGWVRVGVRVGFKLGVRVGWVLGGYPVKISRW